MESNHQRLSDEADRHVGFRSSPDVEALKRRVCQIDPHATTESTYRDERRRPTSGDFDLRRANDPV